MVPTVRYPPVTYPSTFQSEKTNSNEFIFSGWSNHLCKISLWMAHRAKLKVRSTKGMSYWEGIQLSPPELSITFHTKWRGGEGWWGEEYTQSSLLTLPHCNSDHVKNRGTRTNPLVADEQDLQANCQLSLIYKIMPDTWQKTALKRAYNLSLFFLSVSFSSCFTPSCG